MKNKRVVNNVRCEERSGRSGRGNVHVKKNRGLAFQSRTGDQPEALLCPVFMKSVTKKHPSVWGFFLLEQLSNTVKFSVEFNNKKKRIKTKEACGRELIPCQALRLSYRCSASSLCAASSVTGQMEERNVAGGEEEKEWVFAPESDNVVILVPYQVKFQSAKRATSVLPKH